MSFVNATNPRGDRVYFDPEEHKYFSGDQVLTSVTRFVGSFFPKFEAAEKARKYAEKHGETPEFWLGVWDDKREKASRIGSNVHLYAECQVANTDFPDWDDSLTGYYKAVNKALEQLSARFDFLEPEMIVFSRALGLAGTIDLPARDRANGQIVLFDWKTNEGGIEEDSPWRSGLPPVAHLDDCGFSKYTLQLNAYERICQEEGYFYGAPNGYRRVLVHLGPRGGVKVFKVPERQEDIDNMLNWI